MYGPYNKIIKLNIFRLFLPRNLWTLSSFENNVEKIRIGTWVFYLSSVRFDVTLIPQISHIMKFKELQIITTLKTPPTI